MSSNASIIASDARRDPARPVAPQSVVQASTARENARFCRYRQELGLDEALDMHSFRRSYATHLIEAGFDELFVQKQLGHEHASTTAIYEFVSDDYRRAMLRDALNKNVAEALARTRSYT